MFGVRCGFWLFIVDSSRRLLLSHSLGLLSYSFLSSLFSFHIISTYGIDILFPRTSTVCGVGIRKRMNSVCPRPPAVSALKMAQMFPVDRSLLNAKFDGYKLKNLDEDYPIQVHALPAPGATQSTVSSKAAAPLSFEEVQSRIKHNHLSPSVTPGESGYVDAGRNLVIVRVDPVSRFLGTQGSRSSL